MKPGLSAHKVAALAADGVSQDQLLEPINAVRESGADVQMVSLRAGTIRVANAGGGDGEELRVKDSVATVNPSDFEALLIPGGRESVEALARDQHVTEFVRSFMEADKPVATVGEGVLLLAEADVLRGRTVAGAPAARTAVEAAGAAWSESAVEVDQKLVTGNGEDLARFCRKVVDVFGTSLTDEKVDEFGQQSFPASDPLPASLGRGDEPMPPRR